MSFHSSNPAHLARCVSDVKNKIFRYRRFSLKFFLGFLALLLICGAVLWFMLPRFIEDFVAEEAGSVGLENPSIAIDQVRARVDGVAIRGIRLSDNKTDLAIPRLLVSYEWDEALDGAVETGPSPRGMDSLEIAQDERLIKVQYRRFKQGTTDKEPV